MITGPHARGPFYAKDLREIRPEGVNYVMGHFARHYLAESSTPRAAADASRPFAETVAREQAALSAISHVICDEELIERSL